MRGRGDILFPESRQLRLSLQAFRPAGGEGSWEEAAPAADFRVDHI